MSRINAKESREARDEGMRRASDATSPQWIELALEFIRDLAL